MSRLPWRAVDASIARTGAPVGGVGVADRSTESPTHHHGVSPSRSPSCLHGHNWSIIRKCKPGSELHDLFPPYNGIQQQEVSVSSGLLDNTARKKIIAGMQALSLSVLPVRPLKCGIQCFELLSLLFGLVKMQ
jgi:hypothetical protein